MTSTIERDTSVKKVQSKTAPHGPQGQAYLVSGKNVALRRWRKEPTADKSTAARPYETVGYVIAGSAKLHLEGQTIELAPGDAWLVPAHAEHEYEILETFEAVEATSPPARIHERDGA